MELFGATVDSLNRLFADNPAIGVLVGIVVPPLIAGVVFLVRLYVDSRRDLSGRWLLCIYDQQTTPTKFDLYTLRRRRRSVTGRIRRLVSLEDSTQTKRRYGLRGYVKNEHLNYAFWPLSADTLSYGVCTLKQHGDAVFKGLYARPFDETRTDNKPATTPIILTRSETKIEELTAGLSSDQRKHIWKKVFGWWKSPPAIPLASRAAQTDTSMVTDETVHADR